MKYCLSAIVSFLGAGIVFCGIPVASYATTIASDVELTIFVSDMHMGVGTDGDDPSGWHATEDFRWHSEFRSFLAEINEQGNEKVALVLVGDILELWQTKIADLSCRRGENTGCSLEEALSRVRRVLSEHQAVFDSLGQFAVKGSNRLTILPGNHDVALAFPEVRDLVRSAIPAPDERVSINENAYWISADGTVVAEHGQQIGEDPNKFDNWPYEPFVDKEGNRYLQQTWGEAFVQRIFNEFESSYPTIDNLRSESVGLRYAIKHLGVSGTLTNVAKIARFLLFQQTASQGLQLLGPEEGALPTWKLNELSRTLDTSAARWNFIAQSLPPNDKIRDRLIAGIRELPVAPQLTPSELQTACDSRWRNRKHYQDEGIYLCPYDGVLGLGSERIKETLFRSARAEKYRTYLENLKNMLESSGEPLEAFQVYVYGHTHKEHPRTHVFERDATWSPVIVNDGAWQRTASPEIFCSVARGKGLSDAEALKELRPEDFPPCYPFVSIRKGTPPALLYWVQEPGKSGSIRANCTVEPQIPPECEI